MSTKVDMSTFCRFREGDGNDRIGSVKGNSYYVVICMLLLMYMLIIICCFLLFSYNVFVMSTLSLFSFVRKGGHVYQGGHFGGFVLDR